LAAQELLRLCSAQIRKIAYTAPQNSDVDFAAGFLRGVEEFKRGRAAADRPRQAPI
jgi:hypothetical protein